MAEIHGHMLGEEKKTWMRDKRMTENSMWSEFWRLRGHATGGIGIWDELTPYSGDEKEGYTVVVRDSADHPVEIIDEFYTKEDAMRVAKKMMKKLGSDRKFCQFIKKKGGYC